MKLTLIILALVIGQVSALQCMCAYPCLLACGEYNISPGDLHVIQSPNYPNKYGESDDCKWEFTCDNSAGVIGISCNDFKTEKAEEGETCKKADFVRITDSTGIIDFFCDETGPNLQSANNYMEVKFNTDGDSTTKRGFSCSVMCTVETTSTTTQMTNTISSTTLTTKMLTSTSTTTPKHTTNTITPTTITPSSTSTTTPKHTTDTTTPTTITPSKTISTTTNTAWSTDTTTPTTITPSSTSTTTVDPDKTTTEEPTTTPEGGWSGECSKVIIAFAGMKEYWLSPRYDGITHYPQGDYCCSLNITIPDTYDMFMANMVMESPSSIYEYAGCSFDNIQYTSADKHTSKLCGDLSGQTWSEIAAFNAPRNFYFTWCSYRADGKTDIGFKMKITGINLNPSGRKRIN